MKDKEKLRNHHRLEETREIQQIGTIYDPGLHPGEKGHCMVEKLAKL